MTQNSPDNSIIKLTVYINDQAHPLEIPQTLLTEAQDFFAKMDRDMDQGWQMSRTWVEQPDNIQRCQIAADKMLDAISKENETLLMLMAAYICARLPGVQGVRISEDGDMMENEFLR